MKELKDFLQELEACTPKLGDDMISIEDARRIVSAAYFAGINFQAAQHGIQSTKESK